MKIIVLLLVFFSFNSNARSLSFISQEPILVNHKALEKEPHCGIRVTDSTANFSFDKNIQATDTASIEITAEPAKNIKIKPIDDWIKSPFEEKIPAYGFNADYFWKGFNDQVKDTNLIHTSGYSPLTSQPVTKIETIIFPVINDNSLKYKDMEMSTTIEVVCF